MQIGQIQDRVNKLANEKGWWSDHDRLHNLLVKGGASAADLARLAQLINCEKQLLVITEIAEAVEADRNNIFQSDHLEDFSMEEEEHADVIIRELDRAKQRGLRTEEVLAAKMDYNEGRSIKHGKNF